MERRCIFCGGKGLNREHLWSDWISRQFKKGAHDSRRETDQTFSNAFDVVTPLTVKKRHGHATTKRLKVVCTKCNEGWMSGLENAAKPTLQLLMEGRSAVIDAQAQQALVEWIVLKAFIAEHGWPSKPIATQEIWTAFYERREVPQWTSICLFRINDAAWESQLHRHTTGLFIEPADIDRTARNVQQVTFGIGHLLIYVLQSFTAQLEAVFPPEISRALYPFPNGDIAWPPSVTLGGADIENIVVNQMERFIRSNPTGLR